LQSIQKWVRRQLMELQEEGYQLLVW
jgi:hypothetical protein